MAHAIESILPGGEDVEIIIVNDGSKDDTLKIAREYEGKYPDIVRVVDKENGGHGDAVTAGLTHASGSYFKVVDSDDWVDKDSLVKYRSVYTDAFGNLPDRSLEADPVKASQTHLLCR